MRLYGSDAAASYYLTLSTFSMSIGGLCSAIDTDFQRGGNRIEYSQSIAYKTATWLALSPIVVGLVVGNNLNLAAAGMLYVGFLLFQLIESGNVLCRIEERDTDSLLSRLLPPVIFLGLLYALAPASSISIALMYLFSWLPYGIKTLKSVSFNRIAHRQCYQKLKSLLPLVMSSLSSQVYGNVEMYAINIATDKSQVAAYKVAYMFANMAMPIAGVFSFVYLSKIAKLIQEKRFNQMREELARQVTIMIFIGGSSLIVLAIIYPYVASFLYGEIGKKSIPLALWLATGALFNMCCMAASYTLLALRRDKIVFMYTGALATVFVTATFLVVPQYGALGAALVVAATYGVLFICLVLCCIGAVTRISVA